MQDVCPQSDLQYCEILWTTKKSVAYYMGYHGYRDSGEERKVFWTICLLCNIYSDYISKIFNIIVNTLIRTNVTQSLAIIMIEITFFDNDLIQSIMKNSRYICLKNDAFKIGSISYAIL